MAEDVDLVKAAILLELRQFRQEFKTLGPAAQEAGADMTRAMAKEVAKLERISKASAKQISADMSAELDHVGRVSERVLGKMGGMFGEVGDLVFDVVGPLGGVSAGLGAVAAVGGGVAVTVGAVTALVRGAIDLAGAAADSAEELRELGLWVGPDAQADLDRYKEGTRQLTEAWNEFLVAAGAPVASELGVVAAGLADTTRLVVESAGEWNAWGDQMVTETLPFLALARDLIRYGESSLWHALTDSTKATLDQEAALRKLEGTFKDFGPLPEQGGPEVVDFAKREAEERRKAAEERRKAAEAAQAEKVATEAMVADVKTVVAFDAERARLREEAHLATMAQAREEAEIRAITEDILGIAEQLTQETEDYAGSWEQAADVIAGAKDLVSDLGGIATDLLGGMAELEDLRMQMFIDQGNAQVEAATNSAEKWAETEQARIDQLEELGEFAAHEAEAERQRIDDELANRLKNARELDDQEDELAQEAYERTKSLQKTQAIIEAARAGISLIPAFAFLGPFAPLAAAGVAGAALGTQLAIINRTPPPEFPTGLSPDHSQLVSVQQGEPILSRRGNAELERALGAGAAARLNLGLGAERESTARLDLGDRRLLVRLVEAVERHGRAQSGKARR